MFHAVNVCAECWHNRTLRLFTAGARGRVDEAVRVAAVEEAYGVRDRPAEAALDLCIEFGFLSEPSIAGAGQVSSALELAVSAMTRPSRRVGACMVRLTQYFVVVQWMHVDSPTEG